MERAARIPRNDPGIALKLGLTGGAGAGKSTAAAIWRDCGAQVVDADHLARQVLAPGSDGLAQVIAAFGPGVLAKTGELDRAALAEIVFAGKDSARARAKLEAITHPRIAALTAAQFGAAAPGNVVVHDIPLLVERVDPATYHLVVVVAAPLEARLKRLGARGLVQADAAARIAGQASDAERARVADVVLTNAGARAELAEQAVELWEHRLLPFATNLLLARKAELGIPRLAPPDPSWAVAAQRCIARLRRWLGELLVDAEHIGSTSVSGLAAKPILDLQVGLRSLKHLERVSALLPRAGFVGVPSVVSDEIHPIPGDSASQTTLAWAKGLAGSADPGCLANLHLRVSGSAGWLLALQMRDRLRADADFRENYAALKHEVAARGYRSTADYAVAKEPWVAEQVPAIRQWARRTGWTVPGPSSKMGL